MTSDIFSQWKTKNPKNQKINLSLKYILYKDDSGKPAKHKKLRKLRMRFKIH